MHSNLSETKTKILSKKKLKENNKETFDFQYYPQHKLGLIRSPCVSKGPTKALLHIWEFARIGRTSVIQHEMHFENLFVHNENLNNTAVFLFRFSLFICFYLCFNWKLYAWTCEAIKWIKFIFQNSCQVYVWHIGKVHKQQTTDTIIIVLYSNFFDGVQCEMKWYKHFFEFLNYEGKIKKLCLEWCLSLTLC